MDEYENISNQMNPYQTPRVDVESLSGVDSDDPRRLRRIAYWQKVVIWSFAARIVFLISSLAVDLQMVEQPTSPEVARTQFAIAVVFTVVNVVLILVQLVALANLSRALGYSILMTIAFLLLLFLPLIALIVLLVLIGKATRRLKEAGYRVGLFGAKETPPALDAPSDEHAFQDHFSDE